MHTLRKFLFLLLLMSPFLANASAKDFIKGKTSLGTVGSLVYLIPTTIGKLIASK